MTRRPNYPRIEVVMPSSGSEEVRTWADTVAEEAHHVSPGVTVISNTDVFMGAELEFLKDGAPFFAIAVMAEQPSESELEVMRDDLGYDPKEGW